MANPVTIEPALGHAPITLQGSPAEGYDAIDDRRAWTDPAIGEGVVSYDSFRVSQRDAGANLSVDVNMDDVAYVRGDSVDLQGLYTIPPHSETINLTVSAADSTNPRIDQVVLEVKDDTHDASGLNLVRVRVIAGTPTSGATLDNRTGAAELPDSALLLADILVAASDTAIGDAEIRDRRAFGAPGVVPPLLTNVDLVQFQLADQHFTAAPDGSLALPGDDGRQTAALMYLPRRILGANRIRWRYLNNGGPMGGDYLIAIHDASGRAIVDTGAVALLGGATSTHERAEVIDDTDFEPGWYYVLFGYEDTLGAGSLLAQGIERSNTSGVINTRNVLLRSATGGTTAPQTILGFTDVASENLPGTAYIGVPLIALSKE